MRESMNNYTTAISDLDYYLLQDNLCKKEFDDMMSGAPGGATPEDFKALENSDGFSEEAKFFDSVEIVKVENVKSRGETGKADVTFKLNDPEVAKAEDMEGEDKEAVDFTFEEGRWKVCY